MHKKEIVEQKKKNINKKEKMNVIAATAMMKKIRIKGALILADGAYNSEPLHKLIISK